MLPDKNLTFIRCKVKKKKSAHLWVWLGFWVRVRTGDSHHPKLSWTSGWERDVDSLEFEVSQNQVDPKGTVGSGRPPLEYLQSSLAGWVPSGALGGLELLFLWTRRPHFSPPTKLQGGQVLGGAQGAARELGNGWAPRSKEDRFTGRCRSPSPGPAASSGLCLRWPWEPLGQGRGVLLRMIAEEAKGATWQWDFWYF